MNRPEQALQRAIVGYLSWALMPPAIFTSFPAGGGGRVRGAVLKGTGLRAGMPDILIFSDGHTYGVELKPEEEVSIVEKALHPLKRNGCLSANQQTLHPLLRQAGVHTAVVISVEELQALLMGPWWPIPIRRVKVSTELIQRGFHV